VAKLTEHYYYKYDTITNEIVSTKGYENGKLVYSRTHYRINDTIVYNTVDNTNDSHTIERELIHYSPDSLTQTNVLFLSHQPYPHYTILKYNLKHLLIEEIDSAQGKSKTKKYSCDSLGRISSVQWIDSVPVLITEYIYGNKEVSISTYDGSYYYNNRISTKDTLKRFDENGSLLYEEAVSYFLSDDVTMPGVPPKIKTRSDYIELMVKRFYNQNRLVKVEVYHGSDLDNCYEIAYQ